MSRNRGWNLPLKPLECFCLHNLWNAFWLEWLDATNLVTYRSAKLHRGSVGNKSSVVPGSCWLSSEEFLQPNLYGMTLAYFNCATSLPTFAILLQLFMVYPCLPEFNLSLAQGFQLWAASRRRNLSKAKRTNLRRWRHVARHFLLDVLFGHQKVAQTPMIVPHESGDEHL